MRTQIFLHIPKTAGTTLHGVFYREFRGRRIVSHYDDRESDTSDALIKLLGEEKADLIVGHMPYGLHRKLNVPTVTFTMLREPVERVASFYYYMRKMADQPLHQVANALSLEEFVLRGYLPSDSQTRQVAGFAVDDPEFDKNPDGYLERAVSHLENEIVAVGLLEWFDESILLFCEELGWKLPFYRVFNRTSRPRQLSAETRALIADTVQRDQILYARAEALFKRRMEGMPNFEQRLNWFRRRNSVINVVYRPYLALRRRYDRWQQVNKPQPERERS